MIANVARQYSATSYRSDTLAARLSNQMEPLKVWDELGPLLPQLFDKPALSGNTLGSAHTAMQGYTAAALPGGCTVEVLQNSFDERGDRPGG